MYWFPRDLCLLYWQAETGNPLEPSNPKELETAGGREGALPLPLHQVFVLPGLLTGSPGPAP